MASRSVSSWNSYSAPGANGSDIVGPGGFTPRDGCTFKIRIDLPGSPGLGNAIEIGHVQAGIAERKPKVWTGGMV